MTNANWWDGLTDEQIQQLKDNERPLGLCAPWVRDAVELLRQSSLLEMFSSTGWRLRSEITLYESYTYRLRSDWQKPEPSKRGGWEYCEVRKVKLDWGESWIFTRGYYQGCLHRAFSMVGFDGIEYEEWPGQFYMGLVSVRPDGFPSLFEAGKPATPRRVRFWVEGE